MCTIAANESVYDYLRGYKLVSMAAPWIDWIKVVASFIAVSVSFPLYIYITLKSMRQSEYVLDLTEILTGYFIVGISIVALFATFGIFMKYVVQHIGPVAGARGRRSELLDSLMERGLDS